MVHFQRRCRLTKIVKNANVKFEKRNGLVDRYLSSIFDVNSSTVSEKTGSTEGQMTDDDDARRTPISSHCQK